MKTLFSILAFSFFISINAQDFNLELHSDFELQSEITNLKIGKDSVFIGNESFQIHRHSFDSEAHVIDTVYQEISKRNMYKRSFINRVFTHEKYYDIKSISFDSNNKEYILQIFCVKNGDYFKNKIVMISYNEKIFYTKFNRKQLKRIVNRIKKGYKS